MARGLGVGVVSGGFIRRWLQCIGLTIPPAAITSLVTGFTKDYFGDNTVTVSGTCAPGATVEIFNGVTSWGMAAKPTTTTFTLTRTISMAELNVSIYLGTASLTAVPSIGSTSAAVTGTFTGNPALYPGLLACFDPSQVYVDDWGCEYAAQPGAAGLSGANWVGAGNGPYTHTAGATTDLTDVDLLTAGNRFVLGYTVAGCTAGNVTPKFGTTAGTTQSADGAYTEDMTAQSAALIFTPSNDFPGSVTITSLANTSIAKVYPRGGVVGGTFAQATALNMPYLGDNASKINGYDVVRCDGSTDRLVSDQPAASWTPLHEAAGAIVCTILSRAAATNHVVASTSNISAPTTTVGMTVGVGASGYAILRVSNGAAQILAVATAAAAVPADGSPHVVTSWFTEAAGGTIRVDAAADVTAAMTGACSATDPTNTLYIGGYWTGAALGWPLNGAVGFILLAAGTTAITLASKLHTWSRARAAI